MATVVEFINVSKRFTVHRDRRNTLHERLTHLFRPRLEGDVFWALNDISFAIRRGETVGLIGHNGSGKSTTLKLVSRILEPSSGTVGVAGRVSALLELGSGFHPDLSGRENIYLNGSLLGYSRYDMRQKMDEIIEFAEMADFIDMPVKHYSSGMYMRLGFSIAVAVDPDILITDEVLAVGDEHFQRKCLDRIYQLRRKNKTILYVSHALGQVQNLCDRVLWFDHGRLVGEGEPVEMIDAYLHTVNLVERERLEQERQRKQARQQEAAPAEQPTPDQEGVASEELAVVATEPAAEELQPAAEPPPDPEPEPVQPWRWGSREVELTDVEILDGTGQPRTVFESGATIIFRLHYRAHERIEKPVFGVAIHHRNGMLITGPNTRFSDFPIDALEGEGWIDYRIDELPLLEGDFLFTAAIYDDSLLHPFDHHDRRYPFTVQAVSVRERYGLFAIPASWDWRSDAVAGRSLSGTSATLRGGSSS